MRKPTKKEQDQARRLEWFRKARFGMFIHWGLYAQIGHHEWAQQLELWPRKKYEPLAETWHPKPGCQREWAKLAKQAGCRYMVMTTKHHDGFCLFETQTTDYSAPKRGPGRDLVAEYIEAVREQGLKVGTYYSLMDWHHPDGMRCKTSEKARRRFVDYLHEQVRELMSNYGKIDILWYDGFNPLDAEGWESAKLNKMVRKLQPDIIINNRSGLPEDFGTPEGHIVPEEGRMWEACMTTNDSWGYAPIDPHWKTSWEAVSMLTEVAAGGGNLLLNIGPSPEGKVPPQARRLFTEVGGWMNKYGPTVYDATDPLPQKHLWGFTGRFTIQGSTLYYHFHRWPGTEAIIPGIANKVESVKFYQGKKIKFEQTPTQLILTGLPEKAPDPLATVVEIQVRGKLRQTGTYMTVPQAAALSK
ncbi:MAG: alpha-L-fucosidase [candidate division WS1 bacterium]|nr:alpha-L-fucosidase [candidate division WS1 bacterium]